MFEQILPNLFVLYSKHDGANCYLLTGKKKVLVDSCLKQGGELLKDSLKAVGLGTADIDMILHTHGHCDHFAADYLFPKAEIAMSCFDAERVNKKDESFTCSDIFGNDYYPKINSFLKHDQHIEIKPFSLEVIETPGHTKGSVSFYDKGKKLLFSGDVVFKMGFGRFDLVSSSRYPLIESLAKISKLDFEILLPGHGQILKEKQKENIKNVLEAIK